MKMLTAVLFAVWAAPTQPGNRLQSAPPDARGYSRGVDAVAFDAAAAGAVHGWELSLSTRMAPEALGGSRFGLSAVVPLGELSFLGGYEWLLVPGKEHRRGSIGLSLGLSQRLRAGLAYRWYSSSHRTLRSTGAWDLGLFYDAASWLALSLGGDAINGPKLGGTRVEPALRTGVALRPWLGDPWLTVAAETRFLRKGQRGPTQSRFVIDVAPIEGLHLLTSFLPPTEQFWFGLAVHMGGAGVTTAFTPSGSEATDLPWGESALALTLREAPVESMVPTFGRTVEVPLTGDLQVEAERFLGGSLAVSTAALELEGLADDPSVSRIILPIGKLEVGLATVDALRRAVAHLRAAGKEVIAEISTADDKAYMLAAAADQIHIDPRGGVTLDGFAVTIVYLAEALGKIGVRFDAVRVGPYKNAPDQLTRNEPRPEEVEVREAILAQAYADLTQILATDRKLEADAVAQVLDKGLFSAAEALAAGLVDEITQPDDPREPPRVRLRGVPLQATERPSPRWSRLPVIAVVPIVGTIVMQDGDDPFSNDNAGAGALVAELERLRGDDDVYAVVLRIDSPGGDIVAADIVWRAVRRVQQVKPVVVSMGDVAASGGYYIAAPADAILAERNTITGSIGIYMVKPDLSGLYDLVGLHSVAFKKGARADWQHLDTPLCPEDRRRVQSMLDQHYDAFIAKVAAGRNISEKKARELGGGRVYSGAQALELGLVDRIGGLQDAVREAATRAGLGPKDAIEIAIPEVDLSLPDLLRGAVRLGAEDPLAELWAEWHGRLRAIDQRVFVRLPYAIQVDP